MSIYARIQTYMTQLPGCQAWDDLQRVINHAAQKQPRHWLLPRDAAAAFGGSEQTVLPAMASLASLYLSIVAIDDLLDGDGRFEQLNIPPARTANLAVAFLSLAFDAIFQSNLPAAEQYLAAAHISQTALQTAWGQEQDARNQMDEESYWQITRDKSSPFFALAFHLGALYAGQSAETAAICAEIGAIYGEMIQIHDDLSDTLASPANQDWLNGRSPLPILFAESVPHPERDHFLELRRCLSDHPENLNEAQQILFRCGAVSYCLDQLLARREIAARMCSQLSLTAGEYLLDKVDRLTQPALILLNVLEEKTASPAGSSVKAQAAG